MIFITFEGCDFCGKSTQVKLLIEYFKKNKKKVFLTREPGGTKFAEKIRELLLSFTEIEDPFTEYLLISAARKNHRNHLSQLKFKKKYYTISDRFFDSSLCYQGYYKGLDINILHAIKELIIYKFEPQLTFLIDISENEIKKRMKEKKNSNIYDIKSKNFYKIIRKGYLKIAYNNKKRIFILDGNQDIHEINNQIIDLIKI